MSDEIQKRHFRVSVCRMTFGQIEVMAPNALAAEDVAQSVTGATVTFETGSIVHRIEQRLPVPGKPGEYTWHEVPRA